MRVLLPVLLLLALYGVIIEANRPKRKCNRTSKKCSKKGGICVPVKKNSCSTETVDSLCKGASCTCCIEETTETETKCKRSKDCKEIGGFCFKRENPELCENGEILENLCEGSTCSCCIPLTDSDCKCGQVNKPRITGGEEVDPQNRYPWMVGLRIIVSGLNFCGGSLINDRYILTAAHCFFRPDTGQQLRPEWILVGLGDHRQSSTDDDVEGATEYVDISEIIVHPEYKICHYNDSLFPVNDIALLKLKNPVDLTAHKEIKPVCLPTNNLKTYEGMNAIAAGWGYQEYGDYDSIADALLEVKLPIVNPQICADYVETDLADADEKLICSVLDEKNIGVCIGDSGGPLVIRESGRYFIVGITSFLAFLDDDDINCGVPKKPMFFTRVSAHLDWIEYYTEDSSYCFS